MDHRGAAPRRQPQPGFGPRSALAGRSPTRPPEGRAIPEPIRVLVNGDERELPAGTRLHALLEILGVPARFVAVEHNGELMAAGDDRPLASGDRIEIVRFVGGG